MKSKRLLLHIGTEKTGSTAIQRALAQKSKKLRASGVIVPHALGPQNHTHLVAASLDADVHDNIKAHILARYCATVSTWRTALEQRLARELSHTSDWHTIIATSELIHSRLTRQSEIARLLGLFTSYVDEVHVLVFLRRQDELAISRFSSALRAGYHEFDRVFADLAPYFAHQCPIDKLGSDFVDFYDYRKLIERYLVHLPASSIRVVLYPEAIKADGTVVTTFFRNIELCSLLDANDNEFANRGLSASAQYVMSEVNKRAVAQFPSGLRNESLKVLHSRIEDTVGGPERTHSRSTAHAFYERFKDSNEWVRQHFFPDRVTLFDEDFSSYPEVVSHSAMKASLQPILEGFLADCDRLPMRERRTTLLRRHTKRLIASTLQ